MPPKKKPKDRHRSGFMVRLPEDHKTALTELTGKLGAFSSEAPGSEPQLAALELLQQRHQLLQLLNPYAQLQVFQTPMLLSPEFQILHTNWDKLNLRHPDIMPLIPSLIPL